jgi:hypothetical protein
MVLPLVALAARWATVVAVAACPDECSLNGKCVGGACKW